MKIFSNIFKAAVVMTAALLFAASPVSAEEPAKKDPCAHHKIERNKLICQQAIRKSAADIEISKLITDVNYALKSTEAKKFFEGAQESWATYMEWSCVFETHGAARGIEANIDEENCRISYMESRIKHLKRYLGCIGTPPCPN